jgi:hypothetical protein
MPKPTSINSEFLTEEELQSEQDRAASPSGEPTDSDLTASLQLAQANLQNADIAAAHRISDANAHRILTNSAPLTAFKVVQGMSASVASASDMVEAFLPGIPTVGSEMKSAMSATKTNRSFLAAALKNGNHQLLTGS